MSGAVARGRDGGLSISIHLPWASGIFPTSPFAGHCDDSRLCARPKSPRRSKRPATHPLHWRLNRECMRGQKLRATCEAADHTPRRSLAESRLLVGVRPKALCPLRVPLGRNGTCPVLWCLNDIKRPCPNACAASSAYDTRVCDCACNSTAGAALPSRPRTQGRRARRRFIGPAPLD